MTLSEHNAMMETFRQVALMLEDIKPYVAPENQTWESAIAYIRLMAAKSDGRTVE